MTAQAKCRLVAQDADRMQKFDDHIYMCAVEYVSADQEA